MQTEFFQEHWTDKDGNPAGGVAFGNGMCISWQNGPLGKGLERKDPNGAFVEDVIRAAIGRLEFYQASRFRGDENKRALQNLYAALSELDSRTKNRESRGVEGTHEL